MLALHEHCLGHRPLSNINWLYACFALAWFLTGPIGLVATLNVTHNLLLFWPLRGLIYGWIFYWKQTDTLFQADCQMRYERRSRWQARSKLLTGILNAWLQMTLLMYNNIICLVGSASIDTETQKIKSGIHKKQISWETNMTILERNH